jgi:ribonuclease P protein component
MDETYVPTERAQTGKDPRLPQTDVDQGRPGGDPVAPGERTPSTVGMTSGGTPDPGRKAGAGPIRSRRTFEALRQGSSRGRSGPLAVSFLEQKAWSRPEVAYAINRKVGSAVVRNRLRRRLRAIVSEQAASLPVGAYVVRTGPGGSSLGFNELKVAMSQALERAVSGPTGRSRVAVATDRGPAR